MRTAVLWIGLVASAASAQTPAEPVAADSAEAVRDLVVVERGIEADSVVRQLDRAVVTERVRVDSVVVRRETPARSARLAFPTEGGVFYYRAGAGTAIRRAQPAPPPASAPLSEPARADVGAAPPLGAPLADDASPARRAGDRPRSPASNVMQSDLDRLERRLIDRLDRAPRGRQVVPVVVPPTSPVRPPNRPVVTGVPLSRADSLRRVQRAELAEAPDRVPDEPEVTAEEVERAFLDTGLFRTTRIFFAFGEADLLPISRRNLDTISEVLLRYPELRIEVGGHTDAVSSDAFNLALSERRAGSVAAYLVGRGIDAGQITAVGYGEARPVATNETETGRALNRRVEFVVRGDASGE